MSRSRSRSRSRPKVRTAQFAVLAVIGALTVALVVATIVHSVNQRSEQRDLEARDLPAPTIAAETLDPRSTVFIGDSISAVGSNGLNPDSQTAPWNKRIVLEPETPWLNAGIVAVPGEDMGKILSTFIDAAPRLPDFRYAVVLGGTNDALNNVPPEVTASSLNALLDELESRGGTPILISPPPNDLFTERQAAVVELERAIAAERGLQFIDIFTALGVEGQWPPGWTVDGIHPNETGHIAIAEVVLEQALTNSAATS